jgi:pectin methylesterase-like acyl-CoA thioesterase
VIDLRGMSPESANMVRRRGFLKGLGSAAVGWPAGLRKRLGVAALAGPWAAKDAAAVVSIPPSGDEAVGPFASWINVKTIYGAKGDGVADDTAAIQAALNEVGTQGRGYVLYFPAGTYRVTRRLDLANRIYISLFGEDPARTVVKWAGASGGTVLYINGVAYSRFERMTFDGSGAAAIIVDQSWDNKTGKFDTGNRYGDLVFKDAGIGIRGGVLDFGFAETTVLRCRFSNFSQAGIVLCNFNALDLWVHYSSFTDCNYAITNTLNGKGAGNYRVYNSVLKNSKTADFGIGNTGGFSMRHNYSIGSRRFIEAGGTNNPAYITVQKNIILDTTDPYAISIGNQGPIFLYDNVIRSRSRGQFGVVFIAAFSADSDGFAIGNTFTEKSPIGVNNRLTEIDSVIVPKAALDLVEPNLPDTPPNLHRAVVEVPAGAGAGVIQQAINAAVANHKGQRPVVHLPAGIYKIASTITVPANADVQIVGDGAMTQLIWTGVGPGPVVSLAGPSKASLSALQVQGTGTAESIVATNIDQPGSRVFMEGVELRSAVNANLFVDGLDYAVVDAANIGHAFQKTGSGIKVVGGPLAAAGNPRTARVRIFSGSSAGETLPHDFSNGADVLVRDLWYESSPSPLQLRVRGRATVTMENCLVSLKPSESPAYDISDLNGKVAIIGNYTEGRVVVRGDGSKAQVLNLGAVSQIAWPYFFNDASPRATTGLLNSREVTTAIVGSRTKQTPNQGKIDSAFVTSMLAQTRAAAQEPLTALLPGVTDLRFDRVWAVNGLNNIRLTGANAGPAR